jgi:regulator of sigma E protease
VIGKVVAGGPADNAGLKVGDRVLAINGAAIPNWFDFVLKVRDAAGQALQVEINQGRTDCYGQHDS